MAQAIGKAIRAAREARGLTLRQVARTVGMSAPQLSSLEAGRPGNPGWATVVRLAKALGISLDDVAGLSAAKPLDSAVPRAVSMAIKRACKDIEKAAATLSDVAEKIAGS